MKYLVIGLGIYGANLALDLVAMGHEVVGADINRATIDAIKDYITTAYIVDTTEEIALGVLPLRNVDLVIVAIGENFGASVKTIALLKKAGVKTIYARAIDELHESILQSFRVDRILKPEQHAAADLTREMSLGADVVSMAVTSDSSVIKCAAPAGIVGLRYADLRFEDDYGMRLIAVTRPEPVTNVLGVTHEEPRQLDTTAPGLTVADGDTLLLYGDVSSFKNLCKALGR